MQTVDASFGGPAANHGRSPRNRAIRDKPNPCGRPPSTAAIECSRMQIMNGAEIILRTLANNGVEACFSNPGTSRDAAGRGLLITNRGYGRYFVCTRGVATGAADGLCQKSQAKPAATLLHLGAGLSNGSANLHNARRALFARRQYRG